MDKVLLLKQQQSELNEYYIYKALAKRAKNKENRDVLLKIAKDEYAHYRFWKSLTKKECKPQMFFVYWYVLLAVVFGLTFSLRYMERGEEHAQKFYHKISKSYPQAKKIQKEEEEHEQQLIGILHDEKLHYAGAIVLGLNDALVELTGTLAGLTFAFANSTIIAVTGLIVGFAASLSMAASGYLSSREDESNEKNPVISGIYTGIAYIITVAFLVTPYFIFSQVMVAFSIMLCLALLIIALYTFYISVAKRISFWKRFLEMAAISLGVAFISFIFGVIVKTYIGIEL